MELNRRKLCKDKLNHNVDVEEIANQISNYMIALGELYEISYYYDEELFLWSISFL